VDEIVAENTSTSAQHEASGALDSTPLCESSYLLNNTTERYMGNALVVVGERTHARRIGDRKNIVRRSIDRFGWNLNRH
jgi:hypothetical protein